MASYGDLTKEERAVWDEYQTLREISDWPAFDSKQQSRKEDARHWLVDRRKSIWRMAQPKSKGGDGNGWRANNRRARHTFLKDENLNGGAPKHEVRLPAPAVCTNAEKVYIEEREGYLAFSTVDSKQKARKQANVDWLVRRRQQVYRLNKESPSNSRKRRYDALCIATHHGDAYKQWNKDHNKWGVPLKPPTPTADSSSRAGIVRWCKHYVGVKESPRGSNRGEPQPSGWERRVYGGTGIPWCACFAVCSAWDAGVKGSGTASVQANVNLARRGQGIYRGYTTDHRRVRPGDHCAVISTSTHTEVVVGPSAWDCIGGNTGPSNVSNGGMVAGPTNRRGRIVGWMLIREP
jgi:hypothetical protein